MSQEQRYKRDKDGYRFQVGGINTVLPTDALPPGKYPYLQNVRSYLKERMIARATQGTAAETLGASVTSLRRLNDTTPLGPTAGYALVGGAGTSLYLNSTAVSTGMSGNPMSFVPFRPNASVQPWMYVADGNKMLKVNANGTCYFDGIEEPQVAPTVTSQNAVVNGSVTVPSTTIPWSVAGGQNPTYPYTATGGTSPVIIDCLPGATVMLTATGTINVSYGTGVSAGGFGPTASGSPGSNVPGSFCNVLMGAFTDASGNVVTPTTGSGPVTIGSGPTTLLVPIGATQLQLGIDDTAYVSGGGSFTVSYTVTTSAVATNVSILGTVTAYYWGDSPTSGQVASYIWNNPNDPDASAHPRQVSNASGSTTNTSLAFDINPVGNGNENQPMQWLTYDTTGIFTGSIPVFAAPIAGSPANNFANWNMCVVGTLYVPAAGTYTFTIISKDNVMWGIGGAATWSGKGSIRGAAGQSITVVNKSELLPSPPINGEGGATGISVAVTFPGAGDYPIELDYDYWYHSGRALYVTVNNETIAPLPNTVLQNTQYRYVYRSSATGALSNPSPESVQNQNPVQVSTVSSVYSTDPQVDKVDYYRMDSTLDNFTYVGTGPNDDGGTGGYNTPFVDELTDLEIADNPILQFDNYQPFPVIDTPHRGVINVTAGVATWVSGDKFNTRWLAGTIINSGGIAYTLNTRPTSTTTLTATDIADGSNLVYEIDEPLLAAQPMPSMWGPTDNAAYMFACGDPINPGTLYWTKGNNPDSAPDTNQQDVTNPSEPLMNGCILNGIGMVFSTERAWMIYPNFTNAAATVQGVSGSPFSLIESISDRGLYIRTAIGTDGGKLCAFRAKDGIYITSGTGAAKSITDADIYNLFPHEGFVPSAVTVGGYTVYPPDDTQPNLQHLSIANGYIYYDYVDTTSTRRTLVYDMAAGGWVVDVYQYPVTLHVLEEGPAVNGTLVGCSDGSVRPLVNGGSETGNAVVLTPAVNGGDARANKTVGDVFLRASVATSAVNVTAYSNQFATSLTGTTPATLAVGSGLAPYIVDFSNGLARDVADIELLMTWPVATATVLDLWQPDWTDLPENTQDRPTDWTDNGAQGAMFWQGLILEADTMGNAKAIKVQSGDDLSFHVPDQSPVTFNGQSKQALTFTPPFVAHSVRIVTTDGVPWRYWGAAWVAQPAPESVVEWQSEMTSLGGVGWQHIRQLNVEHTSTADLTLTLKFDTGAVPQTITLTVPNSGGAQAKTKVQCPANKFKLVSFRLSSTQPFQHFQEGMEVKVGVWGRQSAYNIVKPFGGASNTEAPV